MEWDTGLEVFRGPSCPYAADARKSIILVPFTLLLASRRFSKNTEFMVKARARSEGRMIIVEDEYCIPRQRVTSASVEALEDCPLDYNAVIHRHPPGITEFSETDYEYINANNDVSILIADGRFTDATMRIQVPCGAMMIVRVPVENIIPYVPGNDFKRVAKRAEELAAELEAKAEEPAPLYQGYFSRFADVSFRRSRRR